MSSWPCAVKGVAVEPYRRCDCESKRFPIVELLAVEESLEKGMAILAVGSDE